jgi:hypothetical protein
MWRKLRDGCGPIRPLKRVCLAVTLSFLFLIAQADRSIAEDESTTDAARTPGVSIATEPAPAERTFTEKVIGFEKAMAETHDRIEKNILDQAIRLDNFFGNPATENLRKTEYELRWRNSFRIEDNGDFKYGATFRANVVLSRINERLRLSIYGDNEATESSQILPQDPGNPGFYRTATQNSRLVNTELRYQFIRTPITDFFIGTGVRVTLPMEAFIRSRYAHIYRLSDVLLFRVAETVFLNYLDDLGETTEISFDRQLNRKTLVRLANSATLSQDIDGMEWGSELLLLRELSPKSAITVAAGAHGNTHIAWDVGKYQVFTRYRRNFLRKWLFLELEPEVSWPRDENGGYAADYSFSFRLEVLFKGKAGDIGRK